MKITNLTIAPEKSWSPVSADNPLRAKIKIDSEKTSFECELPPHSLDAVLDLIAAELVLVVSDRTQEFVAAARGVRAIEGKTE